MTARAVAPVRERGLKLQRVSRDDSMVKGRSREGAWIETSGCFPSSRPFAVAPVRERGLKRGSRG